MAAILNNSRTVLRGASSASRLGAARCFGGSGITFNAGGIETGTFAKLILPDGKEASLPILHPSTGTDKFVNISTLHKQVRKHSMKALLADAVQTANTSARGSTCRGSGGPRSKAAHSPTRKAKLLLLSPCTSSQLS
jgi:hypothetical protein